MTPDTTRIAASVATLLALVPVTLYLLDRSATEVVLSVLCVLLIAFSLYLMFGPAENVPNEPPA